MGEGSRASKGPTQVLAEVPQAGNREPGVSKAPIHGGEPQNGLFGAHSEGDGGEQKSWALSLLGPLEIPQLFTARTRGSPLRPGHIRPCLAREPLLLLQSRTAHFSCCSSDEPAAAEALCQGGAPERLLWVIMLRTCFTEMQGLSDKAHACSRCRGSWELSGEARG